MFGTAIRRFTAIYFVQNSTDECKYYNIIRFLSIWPKNKTTVVICSVLLLHKVVYIDLVKQTLYIISDTITLNYNTINLLKKIYKKMFQSKKRGTTQQL